MKAIIACLSLSFFFSFCYAQNQGRITSKEIKPKAGFTNLYVYRPPKNLLIPDKIQALVVYQNKQQFFSKTIPVNKVGNNYNFLFKAPDSTAVLIFSIVEANKKIPDKNSLMMEREKVFDNNNESGYIIHLHNKAGKRFVFENIVLAILLNDYAKYKLQLKEKPNELLLKMYEDTYVLHPEFKQEDSYLDYLTVLYKVKENAAKPRLLAYAKQMIQINNEANWRNAVSVYRLLKMDEEQSELEKKILSRYPNGELAKENFWRNYYNNKENTEQSILLSMRNYIKRFKDSSANTTDRFYTQLISLLIGKKEWDASLKYEQFITDKIKITYIYDYIAWKLSGKLIDNPGSDLDFAKLLSKRSLDYSKDLLNKSISNDESSTENLKDALNKFSDTYALILYKLGQYDSAFYYQDAIYQQGREMNAESLERYAAYGEKAKGAIFTRQLIEEHLLKGVKSPVMLKQLQSIYKQLNLPEDEFGKLQEKSNLLVRQKTAETIKAKYGTVKASDFSLKNILGQTVSLSSYKNKVIVLDFWATWCIPCRASFPKMQELLNNYKKDGEVVFLFIDVWENKTPQKMQEAAVKIMKDNNYSFNVLLDIMDKVVTDYKVEGIPTKFIIDKKGNMIYTGEPSGNIVSTEDSTNKISLIIEAAKR